jgi:hypothetical protein
MDPPVSRPSPCSARELQERLVGVARPLHPPLAATCCRPRVPLPFPHNGTESPLYLRRRRPLRRFSPPRTKLPSPISSTPKCPRALPHHSGNFLSTMAARAVLPVERHRRQVNPPSPRQPVVWVSLQLSQLAGPAPPRPLMLTARTLRGDLHR